MLRSWRASRQRIFYAVDTEGTKNLVGFLVSDCCNGQPELCGYPSARKANHDESERPDHDGRSVYNVLFLCTGNSARSILAEACSTGSAADGSTRTAPAAIRRGAVNPYALDLLRRQDYRCRRSALEELGRVRGAGAPRARLRLHGLRQRGRRSLSDLARPTDDRALGRARSGRGRGKRGGEACRVRGHDAAAAQPHRCVREPAARIARQAELAESSCARSARSS